MRLGTLAKIAGGVKCFNVLRSGSVSRRSYYGLAAQKKSGFKAKAILGLLMLAGGIYLAFKIFGLAVGFVLFILGLIWKIFTFILPVALVAVAIYAGRRFFSKNS